MAILLVDVHRPTEDQHGAVLAYRCRRSPPAVGLPLLHDVTARREARLEHTGPRGGLMDDVQDTHRSSMESDGAAMAIW
jgi:hypothetical protein